MTKRAILYARVSGDDRKYATSGIESQLADCRKYAGERGYQVVNEFYETPDKATSGADWLPELDRVMKLAQGGGFEVLVVREIDRLARNRFKQMSVEIQLESCGARVEYVTQQFEDSPEGRLLKGLMSEFAEYERAKIKWRTVNGTLRSVKAGNVTTGGSSAPYGYDLVTIDGRRSLVVNEEEAAVIRLIFDLYTNQGRGLYTVLQYLTNQGIPKPAKSKAALKRTQSKVWAMATVNNILSNECYIGRWHYSKTRRTKNTQGKVKNLDRPREEWIEIAVPPIVDKMTFQAAQRQREQNKRLKGKQHKRFYLLGGMIKCGHCGRAAIGYATKGKGQMYQYYVCGVYRQPVRYDCQCDNKRSQRVEEVDRAVWEWVKGAFTSPEILKEALDNYQAQQSESAAPKLQMIDATAARLEQSEQEKARLLKAYATGVLSLDEIASAKLELDKRTADLTQILARLRAEYYPTIVNQDMIDSLYKDADDLRLGIARADYDPKEQRRILENLHVECRLYCVDGQRWIEVDSILPSVCLLAGSNTKDYNDEN